MVKKVEVFWRLVPKDYEAYPEQWRSVFGEAQPLGLAPHALLCALDHGVRSDLRFKNGHRAQFGLKPENANNVRILTAQGVKNLMFRFGYRRSHKPDRIMKAMGADR